MQDRELAGLGIGPGAFPGGAALLDAQALRRLKIAVRHLQEPRRSTAGRRRPKDSPTSATSRPTGERVAGALDLDQRGEEVDVIKSVAYGSDPRCIRATSLRESSRVQPREAQEFGRLPVYLNQEIQEQEAEAEAKERARRSGRHRLLLPADAAVGIFFRRDHGLNLIKKHGRQRRQD